MQSPSMKRRVSLVLASLIILLVNSMVRAQETSYSASFSQNKEYPFL